MDGYFALWLSMLVSTGVVIGVLLALVPDDAESWWVSVVVTAWGVVLATVLLTVFAGN